MKIFFDLEFTGLHQDTMPISIGLIAEDHRTFYGEFTDFDWQWVGHWLQENVIRHLAYYPDRHKQTFNGTTIVSGTTDEVVSLLEGWLEQFDHVEMWGDCLAYDWVLFCQLFGGAMFLPKNVYYIPFDISTLFLIAGIDPDINREAYLGVDGEKHNALWDAKVIRSCYYKIMSKIGQ